MTGLLSSQGIRVSQTRVGASLKRCRPQYHHQRCTSTAKLLNPIPYSADYFGHKIHIDQNEKLVMYGVTHVCARDGFSGKVVGFVTMPVKNNVEIYTHLFRYSEIYITVRTCVTRRISWFIYTCIYIISKSKHNTCLHVCICWSVHWVFPCRNGKYGIVLPFCREMIIMYGIWDQVRVDHGKEFHLMLYVQEVLAQFRTNTNRCPHVQSSSRQVHYNTPFTHLIVTAFPSL